MGVRNRKPLIGQTLEEDYKDYYLQRGWGQKKLANRWGVARGLIFGVLRYHYPNAWADDGRLDTDAQHVEDIAAFIRELGLGKVASCG